MNVLDRWAILEAELNGRVLVGTPGVRDPEAKCEAYNPVAGSVSEGGGTCETDGHYMCIECTEISTAELRRRLDQCEECGAKLDAHENCPVCPPLYP